MLDKNRMTAITDHIDDIDPNDAKALLKALLEVKTAVDLAETETLQEIISVILKTLPKLAKDLGKAEPKVIIDDNHLVFKKHVFQLFNNAFMHLVRNSLDHGLEPENERLEKGKPANGTIKIKIRQQEQILNVSYRDDGRGLNLGRLKEKAIQEQLIAPSDELNTESITQILFKPGLSTAEKVTDVSGRGVGMDAVKNYFEQHGGTISLSFPHGVSSSDGFAPVEFVMTLPASVCMSSI